MPTFRRPTAVVAVAVSAVLFTAGGAYAYWSVSGTGTGSVTVATVKPLVIQQADVKDLALGRPADLNGTVTNPNDFEASLLGTEITVKVKFDVDHHDCDVTNFAIVAPSTKATLIRANGTLELDKGSITMLNTTTDQAACHGATLTLDYLLRQAPTVPSAKAPAPASSVPATPEPTTSTTTPQTPPNTAEPKSTPVTPVAGSTAATGSTATAEVTTSVP
jgi:hypothetical protein